MIASNQNLLFEYQINSNASSIYSMLKSKGHIFDYMVKNFCSKQSVNIEQAMRLNEKSDNKNKIAIELYSNQFEN